MPETPLMPGINYSQNVRALQFLAIGGFSAKPLRTALYVIKIWSLSVKGLLNGKLRAQKF